MATQHLRFFDIALALLDGQDLEKKKVYQYFVNHFFDTIYKIRGEQV